MQMTAPLSLPSVSVDAVVMSMDSSSLDGDMVLVPHPHLLLLALFLIGITAAPARLITCIDKTISIDFSDWFPSSFLFIFEAQLSHFIRQHIGLLHSYLVVISIVWFFFPVKWISYRVGFGSLSKLMGFFQVADHTMVPPSAASCYRISHYKANLWHS